MVATAARHGTWTAFGVARRCSLAGKKNLHFSSSDPQKARSDAISGRTTTSRRNFTELASARGLNLHIKGGVRALLPRTPVIIDGPE